MKIFSDFAILDVKHGRKRLADLFTKHPKKRVPVIIRGYIEDIHGNDDGISQEFTVIVYQVETPNGAI